MAVDERLKPYWNNVLLWHRTGDTTWVGLLDVLAFTDDGPSGRAAKRFVQAHNKEIGSDAG